MNTEQSNSPDAVVLRAIWRLADDLCRKSVEGCMHDPDAADLDIRLGACRSIVREIDALLTLREHVGALERDLDGFKNGPL